MADDNHDEDDGSEELVLTVELEGSETTGVPYRRWTELPALEPGAYRLTRSSETTEAVGVFWVREDGSRPAAAGGWTVVSPEESGLEPGAQVLGITGFGDGFVAAGRILPQPGQGSAMPLAVWRSGDGRRWERLAVPDAPDPTGDVTIERTGDAVEITASTFGGGATVLRSEDLRDWSTEPVEANGRPGSAARFDDVLIDVTGDGPAVSEDGGDTWSAAPVTGVPDGTSNRGGPYVAGPTALATIWQLPEGDRAEMSWIARTEDGRSWTVDEDPRAGAALLKVLDLPGRPGLDAVRYGPRRARQRRQPDRGTARHRLHGRPRPPQRPRDDRRPLVLGVAPTRLVSRLDRFRAP